MKLIIDIPDDIQNTIESDEFISREQLAVLQMHILNGIPLDKIRNEMKQEIRLRLGLLDCIPDIMAIIDKNTKGDAE